MDKKEAAKLLFMEGWSQADIARMLSVSTQSINKWVDSGDWKNKRLVNQVFESTSIERLRRLVSYQLEAIDRKCQEWEDSGEYKLLERGDIDALSKMMATIRRPELKWDDYVRILKKFMEFVAEHDLDIAKRLDPLGNEYLNEIRKHMN